MQKRKSAIRSTLSACFCNAGSSAPKRARLSAAPDLYVVDSLLKCSGLVGEHVHGAAGGRQGGGLVQVGD